MRIRRHRRSFALRLLCAASLLAGAACGPIDGVMSADLDGRTYLPSCKTNIPASRLGDPIGGVDVGVPQWAETDERQIQDLALEEAFAVHMPDGVCVRRARWVLFFNDDLPRPRTTD